MIKEFCAFTILVHLAGCGDNHKSDPTTVPTVAPTNEPVNFPYQFGPLLNSPLFVDPQGPYTKSPVDEFIVKYARDLAANFSVNYDQRPEFLVGGTSSSYTVDYVLTSYSVFTLQKPKDPIARQFNQVRIDLCTVSVLCSQVEFNDCLSHIPSAWEVESAFPLETFVDTGARSILDATEGILKPGESIIALRTFSAFGSSAFVSYDPYMFFAQAQTRS